MTKIADLKLRIDELEEELRQSKNQVKHYKDEIAGLTDYLVKAKDWIEETNDHHQQWMDVLQMVQDDDGMWSMSLPYADLIEDYDKLLTTWNNLARRWNREVAPQPVGRPLAASDDQVKQVNKLRKKGRSIRGIALDTGLSLSTVRTIINKEPEAARKQKAKRKQELNRLRAAEYRARVKQLKMLQKQTPAIHEDLQDVITAGKGLK